jgi:maltooligosyltrehalose trehalohydrolase
MSNSRIVASAHCDLGARLLGENACSFLVWAPRASRVEVCISEPGKREIVMQAVGDGYFHAIVEDVAAGALYRYRLNDEKERADPASRYQPEGVHGPSQIIDGRFSWKDSGWRGLPLESYVLIRTPRGNVHCARNS